MMCFRNLYEEFRRLEGQPVKIIMNDRHTFFGLVLTACECSCRILDRCGDIMLVEYCHIDSVVEPQMRLHCHCKPCGCKRDDEEFMINADFCDDECEGERDHEHRY